MSNILSTKPDNAQSIELTDEQVAGMDDTAAFMHTKPVFEFAPSGIKHERAPKVVRIRGLQSIHRHGIPITGRAQGEADMHRRAALCKAGI